MDLRWSGDVSLGTGTTMRRPARPVVGRQAALALGLSAVRTARSHPPVAGQDSYQRTKTIRGDRRSVHGVRSWIRTRGEQAVRVVSRHRGALDPLIAAGLLGPWWVALADAPRAAEVTPWAYVFAAGGTLPVAVRRRWPRSSFALAAASVLAALVSTDGRGATGIGAAFIGYTLIVETGRAAVGWVALVGVGLEALSALRSDSGFQSIALDLILLGAVVVAGYATRTRHANTALLEERAARHLHDKAEAAAAAVAAERAHIARELHDIVAHAMSQITVQAGMGRMLGGEHPERATESLAAIETLSRSAMAEMRRLTRALRDGDDRAPTHGLADVARLADDLVASGVTTEVSVDGVERPLPPGVDAAAYRIVQEALTNAARHASPTCAHVVVRYAADDLTISVTDQGPRSPRPPSATSGGFGLRGMRERASILGGEFEAGPVGSGFGVWARLPTGDER